LWGFVLFSNESNLSNHQCNIIFVFHPKGTWNINVKSTNPHFFNWFNVYNKTIKNLQQDNQWQDNQQQDNQFDFDNSK